MTTNPWNNKQLRSIHDPTINGFWFSVIDLFAILTDSNHRTAQVYWKQLKYNRAKFQLVSENHQLKFKSPNGKYYFTEVVDFQTLINLLQTCPSPKANPFRLWLADMLFKGIPVTELEKELAKLGEQSAIEILEKYKGTEPYARLTVHKESIFPISGSQEKTGDPNN